jgi:hypothetical protein
VQDAHVVRSLVGRRAELVQHLGQNVGGLLQLRARGDGALIGGAEHLNRVRGREPQVGGVHEAKGELVKRLTGFAAQAQDGVVHHAHVRARHRRVVLDAHEHLVKLRRLAHR